MNFYVGVTDYNWFDFLRQEPREDINFWKPLGGGTRFGAVPPGAPFLLKLKKPHHCIAGVGFFTNQIDLPIATAWDMFGPRNGAADYPAFAHTIQKYRAANGKPPEPNPLISCLVLNAPIFFRKPDWIPAPESWGNSIVTGKVYSTAEAVGGQLWAAVSATMLRYQQDAFTQELATDSVALESPGIYREALTKVRVGQGAFRAVGNAGVREEMRYFGRENPAGAGGGSHSALLAGWPQLGGQWPAPALRPAQALR
ncbi:hypothetical protein GCM10027422_26410 [Hymenobacter arcticus]